MADDGHLIETVLQELLTTTRELSQSVVKRADLDSAIAQLATKGELAGAHERIKTLENTAVSGALYGDFVKLQREFNAEVATFMVESRSHRLPPWVQNIVVPLICAVMGAASGHFLK